MKGMVPIECRMGVLYMETNKEFRMSEKLWAALLAVVPKLNQIRSAGELKKLQSQPAVAK